MMVEVFLKLIEQLNAAVSVLLLLLVAVGFVLWKLSAWNTRQQEHSSKIAEASETKDKVIALQANVGKSIDFGERIVRIETTLNLIYDKMVPNKFAQANSPISLTEQGKSAADELNVSKTVDRLYPQFKALIGSDSPNTAYDIQESAFRNVSGKLFSLLLDGETLKLKDFAFKQGVPVEMLLVIYQVLIRDRYLNDMGIPISEIDTHDPAQNNK